MGESSLGYVKSCREGRCDYHTSCFCLGCHKQLGDMGNGSLCIEGMVWEHIWGLLLATASWSLLVLVDGFCWKGWNFGLSSTNILCFPNARTRARL